MPNAQSYVVVVFNGVSLGSMSFAFGVFDLAAHYGALPDVDIRVVSGEDDAALTGGGLADWRDPPCQQPVRMARLKA